MLDWLEVRDAHTGITLVPDPEKSMVRCAHDDLQILRTFALGAGEARHLTLLGNLPPYPLSERIPDKL